MEFQRRVFLKQSVAGLTALPLLGRTKSYAAVMGDAKGAMGEAKFVDVDGIRTRYFDRGSGDALVLVHGGHFGLAGAGNGWMPIFNHLADHYSCVCLR